MPSAARRDGAPPRSSGGVPAGTAETSTFFLCASPVREAARARGVLRDLRGAPCRTRAPLRVEALWEEHHGSRAASASRSWRGPARRKGAEASPLALFPASTHDAGVAPRRCRPPLFRLVLVPQGVVNAVRIEASPQTEEGPPFFFPQDRSTRVRNTNVRTLAQGPG